MAFSIDELASAAKTKPEAALDTNSELKELVRLLTQDRMKKLQQEEAEEHRREANKQAELAAIREAQEIKLAQQSYCNHMQDEGKGKDPCVVASIHSDGMMHMFCPRCEKRFKPVKATPEQISNGVKLIRVPQE